MFFLFQIDNQSKTSTFVHNYLLKKQFNTIYNSPTQTWTLLQNLHNFPTKHEFQQKHKYLLSTKIQITFLHLSFNIMHVQSHKYAYPITHWTINTRTYIYCHTSLYSSLWHRICLYICKQSHTYKTRGPNYTLNSKYEYLHTILSCITVTPNTSVYFQINSTIPMKITCLSKQTEHKTFWFTLKPKLDRNWHLWPQIKLYHTEFDNWRSTNYIDITH